MNALVPGEYTFNILGIVPQKYETGKVVAMVHIEDVLSKQKLNVEFPYHHDYLENVNQKSVNGSIGPSGTIDLLFASRNGYLPFGLGTTVCPFCQTPLINSNETSHSDVYCFSPGCGSRIPRIRDSFYRLNLPLTEEEFEFVFSITAHRSSFEVHLLSIFDIVGNLYHTSREQASPVLTSVYFKLRNRLRNFTVSDLLKFFNIPAIYDEAINFFDTSFGSIEEFWYELQNYRSLNPRLPMYDPNLMNLIYINLVTINSHLVEYFFALYSKAKDPSN